MSDKDQKDNRVVYVSARGVIHYQDAPELVHLPEDLKVIVKRDGTKVVVSKRTPRRDARRARILTCSQGE